MADTKTKVLVLFYSTYGHIYKMAEAVADGARAVPGAQVDVKRVPETLPDDALEKMGAVGAKAAFARVPVASVDDLGDADVVLLGVPTRFGNMAAQMRAFLDASGPLWAARKLVGKVGSVFSSSATQHGGQETTIISTHTTLLHHGMVIVGLPYTFAGQTRLDEVTGGSPYGASTITGGKGERMPSENELAAARYQGEHATRIGAKLRG